MERLRRQRLQAARSSSASKVTTIVERSSDDQLNFNDEPLRGNLHGLKQKVRKPESGSSSRGRNRTTLEDQLAFELGRTRPLSPAGNSMSNLLRDEMLKETESRRRAPTVIAKLMGLDRMPSQNGIGKQPKRPSESFHGQTASGGTCRHRKSCKNQTCRKVMRQQELFKDVYEVRESLKGRVEGYSSEKPFNRKYTEDEMAFIRQKFMDAKRLSTDEKLQDSKEFHDAIDVLNSNNHLFLKLLQEPNSLFAKHLHDTHASPQSHCANVRDLKVSKILDYNINAIGCQTGREGSQKIDISFSRHCQEGVRGHVSHKHAPCSDKYVTSPAVRKEVTSTSPTKIVLLKPHLERSQKTAKSFSSSSQCEIWSDVDVHTTKQTHDRQVDTELWCKKRLPIDLDFSAHKSRESRELAKEITQQMKTRLGEVSVDVPLAGCKGYSADESSHDMSGNDSSNESDSTFLTSRTPYSSSFRGKSPSSRLSESSVNNEGKKRLSERWRMTHRSQEIRMEKGTTLGEMLSMPDWDIISPKLDKAMVEDGSSGRVESNARLAEPVEPLGISSKDGWKHGSIRSFTRSRSLPNAHHCVKNTETHKKQEVLATERFLAPREGVKHCRKKAAKRDSSLKEGSSSESKRMSDKKSQSSCCTSKELGNIEQEDHSGTRVEENKSVLEEKDSPENKIVTRDAPTFRLDAILNLDSSAELEHENIHVFLKAEDDLLPQEELSTNLHIKDDSSSSLLHESSPQNHAAQPVSPSSSKEADQPSPVSVLEAPFCEDPSSGSECFERVSADLHGLRMQLQLLKLESESYDEGSLLISSDEDETSTRSADLAKEPKLTEEHDSWQASYTTDLLAELELEDSWQASEFPVGPWVFDKLESKYSTEQPDCSKLDRELLFDRLKEGITEITHRSKNPHPWVKIHHGDFRTKPELKNVLIESELCKLLADQTRNVAEAAVCSDVQWMDLTMQIDCIGREIGKMVLEELIAESMAM
ncbi:hypothetical protein V2J09_018916 [Rumex salicifolius]